MSEKSNPKIVKNVNRAIGECDMDAVMNRVAKDETLRDKILTGLPVTEHQLNVAGIPTAYLEGGQGPPIVLLHGQGEFAATWMRVFPELVKTNRIIVPDLPGHGATGIGKKPLDIKRVIQWLDELIGHTCSDPPLLSGHLLGGSTALHYALSYEDNVQQIVLVDTLGLVRYRPELKFFLAMVGFVIRPTDRTRDRLFRQCMLDLDDLHVQMDGKFKLLEAYALDRAKSPKLKTALRSLMPAFAMKPIPGKQLAEISIPVSLIWGRYDRQVKLQVARDASKKYGWPLHIIDNTADDPAVEQPDAFLKALYSTIHRNR
jgi:pimeloyl-ACP methyl ester carboxylesterase